MEKSKATLTLRFNNDFGTLVVEENFPMDVFEDENFDFNWLLRNMYEYGFDNITRTIKEVVNKVNHNNDEKRN